MNGPAEHMLANAKPAMPRFHTIGWSFLHGRADFDIENLETLLSVTPESRGALIPPPGRRGFPTYPEKPRVVIGKRKKGPPPSDIEMFGDYWLVSDRLKVLFEALDASAFAFQSCDVLTSSGSAGPTYWLCDVVRVLEAFDEQTSQRLRQNRLKFPSLRTARLLYFDAVAIGKAHIFRTPYWIPDIFCDQIVKDACKRAGIKGLRFVDCTPKTARKQGSAESGQ